MTISTRSGSSSYPLVRTATDIGRRIVGNRFGLLTIAAVALGLGLTLNWSWLVAAGIAPVILSTLPCAVMCALGLCMFGMGDGLGKQPAPDGAASPHVPETTNPPQLAASSNSSDGAAEFAEFGAVGESTNLKSCCNPR